MRCAERSDFGFSPRRTGQVPPGALSRAQGQVAAMALRIEEQGTQQSDSVFRRLKEIIARMAALPGQRSIVLISPGFIYPTLQVQFSADCR